MITLFDLGLALLAFFFFMNWFIERSKIKRIQSFLGKAFVRSMLKFMDGILLFVLDETRDMDIVFVPHYQKDGKFYYVEYKHPDGSRKYHYKIAKKDTFTLRNRLKVAIVFQERMRAININQIAVASGLPDEAKKKLLEDYKNYHSLKELYNRLAVSLATASDALEIQEKTEQMKEIREKIEKLKERWKSGIFQIYDKDSVVLIEDEDSDYITLIRSVDLDEMDDLLTGVHPEEIEQAAMFIFTNWYSEAIKEFGRAIGVAKEKAKQSSMLKFMLFMGAGIVGLIMTIRLVFGG